MPGEFLGCDPGKGKEMEPHGHSEMRSQSWGSGKVRVTRVPIRRPLHWGDPRGPLTYWNTDQLMLVRKLSEAKEKNTKQRLEGLLAHTFF